MQNTEARPGEPVLRFSELTLRDFAKAEPGALRLYVPHLSSELTRSAMAAVGVLARNLGARVTLLAVQVVPFPLPLDQPHVAPRFLVRELKAIAHETEAQVDVRLAVARDRNAGLALAIPRGSLVVVAAKKSWLPAAGVRLARSLAKSGHSVALLEI